MRWLTLFFILHCMKAQAEAFGNNAILVPKASVIFFDRIPLNGARPWGLSHQWAVGTTYYSALNYRWWWLAETTLGFGSVQNQSLASLIGGAGLRYDIFNDDFRPHLSLGVQYLQFLGRGTKALSLGGGWPIFIGLRSGLGLEWLFYSEMALVINGAHAIYFNINEPPRNTLDLSLSFAFYF